MAEWFEDESFWIEMYPFMFPEERFITAEEQVEQLLELVGFTGETVLDLCCGPGRHSVLLARKGLQVTGVDRTPFLLDKARERARKERVEVEWVQEDMRTFLRPGSFDLALSMFTSFGYFDDKEEDIGVLRNIHQNLKTGGACLIDVAGKEWLARAFQPTTSSELPDGTLLVQRHQIFDAWTRIRNEWILIRGGESKSFEFHHTIYSGQELRDRLEQVGFGEVRIYGGLDGREYGPDCNRLVAVAWK